MRGPVVLALVVLVAAGIAGCGSTPSGTTVPDAEPTAIDEPTEPTEDDPGGGASASPSDTPSATPSPSPSASPPASPSPSPSDEPEASPTELAGEPFEGPPLGGRPASLAVVGVDRDDVLNVRRGPGTDEEVVTTLDPLATEVAATGRARLLPGSIWLEVTVGGTTGWASSRYLAFLGRTDDITQQVIDAAGSRPRAATLPELASTVAALRASEEPPSRIAVSGDPSVGDLGEVTVDVVGIGDDAILGERLVVFATQDDAGSFTLRTVEATQLCMRGPGTEAGCP